MSITITTNMGLKKPDQNTREPASIWTSMNPNTDLIDAHDHSNGKGLGVKRIQTGTTPAASGELQVTGDTFRWWGATAAAVRTAQDLESAQTVTGVKTHSAQIVSALGTITADTPGLSMTATWNNAAVTFAGLRLNITDTASNAASLLADLQVGGSSKFSVRKDGRVTIAGSLDLSGQAQPRIIGGSTNFGINDSTGAFNDWNIDSSGRITAARNPAFLAYQAGGEKVNITGVGTAAALTFPNEIFDRGSNYATGTFTAPVTGVYRFSVHVTLSDLTTAMNDFAISLATSNRTYQHSDWRNIGSTSYSVVMQLDVLADMDAGDTASVTVRVFGGGADQVDVAGSGTSVIYSWFSGELVA